MNLDNRLFVDSETKEPLPPLFKGKIGKYYPGQMVRRSSRGMRLNSTFNCNKRSKQSGLRRYVFRYENGKFVYLATRKGQRNGGFDSKPTQTTVKLLLNGPNIATDNTFTALSGSGLTIQYKESENSTLQYNTGLTRWEWTTRPALTASFVSQAFSGPTSNIFRNSGAVNEVPWTYVDNAWTTATPQIPVIATIEPVEWFNNNSIENLNKWPIKNYDADYDIYQPQNKQKWQGRNAQTGAIIPDRRIKGLTDDFLHRCFQGVPLKNYSIVFVEVMWRFRLNKSSDVNGFDGNYPATYVNSSWGYYESIHDNEWWSPKPFYSHTQKGRVYRIGILEADTGVGGYDKVLWAQRTKIITTHFTRGGRTVLD
jgi:hypothetical protein